MDAFVALEACRMVYRQYQTGEQERQLEVVGANWRIRKCSLQGPAGGRAPPRLVAVDLDSAGCVKAKKKEYSGFDPLQKCVCACTKCNFQCACVCALFNLCKGM